MQDDHPDEIMDELRAALAEADAVPPHLMAAAQASFGWRTIDADLAELTYDSLLDDDRLVTVRSTHSAPATAGGPRALTFERAEITVDIEITPSTHGRTLLGQVVGPTAEAVVVERARGTATTELAVDDLGRFRTTDLAPGPVRLRCRLEAGEPDIVTDWFVA